MAGGRVSLGAAEFELSASTQKFQQDMLAAEGIAQKSSKQISAENEKRIRAMEVREDKWLRDFDRKQAQQAASVARHAKAAADAQIKEQTRVERERAKFSGGVGNAIGVGAGLAGVTLGVAGAAQAIRAIAQATDEATRSQLALGRQFSANRDTLEEFAQQSSRAFGIGLNDVRESINLTATLQRNYGLTTEQIKKVITVSADLAALTGKDLPDATARVQAALRGEAEAAEQLGLTLNSDAIKAMAQMTDEQRKNFESLGPLEKAQIIYNELMRQTADLHGSAAERAGTAAGAFDKLGASTERLGTALGKTLLPFLAPVASGLGGIAAGLAKLLEDADKLSQRTNLPAWALAVLKAEGLISQNSVGGIGGEIDIEDRRARQLEIQSQQRAEAVKQAEGILAEQRKRQTKQELEDRQEQADNLIRVTTEGLREEQENKDRAFAEQRIKLTKARDFEIRTAEETRDAKLKGIEAEEEAFKDQHDKTVAFQQQEREAAKDVAEWKRDTAIKALDDEKDAAKDRFDDEIKQSEIARDKRQDDAEAKRDTAVKALEDESRAVARARTLEDRDISDRQEQEQRALQESQQERERAADSEQRKAESKRDRALGRIDREKDKSQAAHDAIMRQIDERSDASERLHRDTLDAIDQERESEKQRHDEVMRALEDEEQQRLGILDAQIALIEAEDQAAQDAQQDADQQERLRDAQSQLANEREVAAGIGGDPKLIAAAQKDVQKIEEDIRTTRERRERDSQRTQLEDQKKTISDEIQARKDQLDQDFRDTDLKLQKRRDAADAEYQIVRDQVEKEKQAAADGLADRTKKLEQQATAARDSADKQIASIRDRRDKEQEADREDAQQLKDRQEREQRALDDRRYAEDEDRRVHREEVQKAYEAEREEIRKTFDDEATGSIPALRRRREATIKEFEVSSKAVKDAYDAEQRDIFATYDNPQTGIFAKLKQQADDAKREYDRRKADVGLAYKAEQDQIHLTYDDQEHGLFAKLAKSSADTKTSTEDQIKYWQQWGKDVRKEIELNQKNLDAFIASGQKASSIGGSSQPGQAHGIGSPAIGPGGSNQSTFEGLYRQALGPAESAGLPADVIAAIPINEGVNSTLQTKYNNLFSIKGKGPAGSVSLPTQEVDKNGNWYWTESDFAVYNNASESFADFIDLITGSSRYQPAVNAYRKNGDPAQFIKMVNEAGYATDPDWWKKVLRIAGIPGYASGGIAWHPQLAMVGERGPEAIIPLADRGLSVGRFARSPDSAWGGAMSRMSDYEKGRGKRGGDTTIINNGVGEQEVTQRIIRALDRRELLRGA